MVKSWLYSLLLHVWVCVLLVVKPWLCINLCLQSGHIVVILYSVTCGSVFTNNDNHGQVKCFCRQVLCCILYLTVFVSGSLLLTGHRDVVIPEAGVVVGPGQGGGEADPEVVLMNVVTEATHLQSHDQGQDPAHTTPNRDQNLVQSLDQNPDQSLSRLALSHHAEV